MLAASYPAIGLAAYLALTGLATALALRQGALALAMLIAALVCLDLPSPVGDAALRYLLSGSLAGGICGWYWLRRRIELVH